MQCFYCNKNITIITSWIIYNKNCCLDCFEDFQTEDYLNFYVYDPTSVSEIEKL